jgi:hypothetical protein
MNHTTARPVNDPVGFVAASASASELRAPSPPPPNERWITELLLSLYIITGVHDDDPNSTTPQPDAASGGSDPADPAFVDALRTYVDCFRWVYPLPVATADADDLFEYVLRTHAEDAYLCTLVPFDLDGLIATYLGEDVPPSVWGPKLWLLLHALACYEPRHVPAALHALTVLLPCGVCAADLRAWLKKNPYAYPYPGPDPAHRDQSRPLRVAVRTGVGAARRNEGDNGHLGTTTNTTAGARRASEDYVVALHNHVNKKLKKNIEMLFASATS